MQTQYAYAATAYDAADTAFRYLDRNPNTTQTDADKAWRAAYLAFRTAIDARVQDARARDWDLS